MLKTFSKLRLFVSAFLAVLPAGMHAQNILIDVDPGRVLNRFDPQQTLGSSIDRVSTEAVEKGLTKRILDQVAPSGWGPITYRNNTELAVEAWHWNSGLLRRLVYAGQTNRAVLRLHAAEARFHSQ